MTETRPGYLAGDNAQPELPPIVPFTELAQISRKDLAALRRQVADLQTQLEYVRQPVVWNIPHDAEVKALVESYYSHRYNGTMPDAGDALLFVLSEAGELADAVVSEKPGWIRNNPDKVKSVPDEIGDVLQMLYVFAMRRELDPLACMLNKWRSKGWRP